MMDNRIPPPLVLSFNEQEISIMFFWRTNGWWKDYVCNGSPQDNGWIKFRQGEGISIIELIAGALTLSFSLRVPWSTYAVGDLTNTNSRL